MVVLLILGTPIEGLGDQLVFLLEKVLKGWSCLVVLVVEHHHLIVRYLVHVPRVCFLNLFVKDFEITGTGGIALAHGPEPLVTEMNLDLSETFNVLHDVAVECIGCSGVNECGVVEVSLVGVLGHDVDVVFVDGEDFGELGHDECLDLLDRIGEGTGIHPGNAEGSDCGHGFRKAFVERLIPLTS